MEVETNAHVSRRSPRRRRKQRTPSRNVSTVWSTGSTQHRMCLVDTNLAGLRNHPKISGERRVEDRPSIDGPNGSLEQVRKRGEQRVRKKQAKQKKESEKKKRGDRKCEHFNTYLGSSRLAGWRAIDCIPGPLPCVPVPGIRRRRR